MREIKYRGVIVRSGAMNPREGWVYGDLLRKNGRTYIIEDGRPYEVDQRTVGQYTGLKDNSGMEIYEGDVVRVVWGGVGQTGAVTWEDRYTGYMPFCDDEDPVLSAHVEVIGNTYESPGLLEKAA